MSNILKIGLDLDGVIIDHTSNKIQKAKELGYDITLEETPSEVLKKIIKDKDRRKIQRFIYGEGTLLAPAITDALNYIKTLQNHLLFIISRRNQGDNYDKTAMEWLEKHDVMASIPSRRIFFVPHDVVGAKDKIASRFGVEVFIDDQLKILQELPSVKTRILFDPYDISNPSPPFLKIKKWQELPAILENV